MLAQPVNDLPCNATALSLSDPNCPSYVQGNLNGATPDDYLNDPQCGMYMSCPDVWYSFVQGANPVTIALEYDGGMNFMAMAIYGGACGSGLEVDCDENSGPTAHPYIVTDPASLTPGNTYYIRIWSPNCAEQESFQIYISDTASVNNPPVNDNCYGATNLNAFLFGCLDYTAGCLTWASPSIEGNTSPCGIPSGFWPPPQNLNSDVWYTFTSFGTSVTINLQNISGTNPDVMIDLYQGSDCSNLTYTSCSNNGSLTAGPLMHDSIYYVRVYQADSAWVAFGGPPALKGDTLETSYEICIEQPNILGVEVVNFQAKALNHSSIISWDSESEVDNAYFLLEKSRDGQNFKLLQKIKGAGNSVTKHHYSFEDEDPAEITYYRLKAVDFNEITKPIATTSLVNINNSPFSIFPNPTRGAIAIRSETSNMLDLRLSILSVDGVKIHEIFYDPNSLGDLNILADYQSGIYILQITTPEGKLLHQEKLIKQ